MYTWSGVQVGLRLGPNIVQYRGGHIEIQNWGIKLHDRDCHHTNMLHGDKKIVTLVHQTGNSNLVMHMHYMSKSISQGSGKYWELPSNTGKYREKLANTGK